MSSRRRPTTRSAIGALLLLVAVACSGGGDVTTAGDSTTSSTGTTLVADPGTTPPPAGDGGGATPTSDPGTGATTPSGGEQPAPDPGGPPPPTSPAQPVAAFPALDAGGPPGSFGPSLLRPDRSERIVLEIQSAPGAAPSASTVQHVQAAVQAAAGKPVVVVDGRAAPGSTDWSSSTLQRAADQGATTAQGSGTAVLRLLFVHGTYEGNDGVLGVAVRGDVAAVFRERIDAATGLLGDPDAVERSVATHEVGHLLGLVDLVLDTGRADPDHPGHSANPGSVMYWAVETDLISSLLGAHPPQDFDGDDLADLRAIAAGR